MNKIIKVNGEKIKQAITEYCKASWINKWDFKAITQAGLFYISKRNITKENTLKSIIQELNKPTITGSFIKQRIKPFTINDFILWTKNN